MFQTGPVETFVKQKKLIFKDRQSPTHRLVKHLQIAMDSWSYPILCFSLLCVLIEWYRCLFSSPHNVAACYNLRSYSVFILSTPSIKTVVECCIQQCQQKSTVWISLVPRLRPRKSLGTKLSFKIFPEHISAVWDQSGKTIKIIYLENLTL